MRKIVLGIGIFLASWGLGQLQEVQALLPDFENAIDGDWADAVSGSVVRDGAKNLGRTVGGVAGIVTDGAAGLTEGINEGLGNSTEDAVEQLNMLIEKGKDVKEIEEQVKCVKELLTKGFGSAEIEKRCILSVGPDGSFALPSAEKFNQAQTTSLRTFILDALNFVLGFLGIVAVAVIIYSGYTYVTASEDESRAEKAKNMIIWVSIGLVIILVSFAYVNTIITHLPTGGEDERYCSENPDDPDCIGGADTEINGTSAEGDVDSFYQDKGEAAEVIIVGNEINLIDGSGSSNTSDENTATEIEVTTPNLLYDGSGSSQRIYADLPTAVNGLYFQIPSAIDGYVEDNLDNRANFIRLKNDSTDESKTEENCARNYYTGSSITNKCQFFKLPFTQGGSYSINGEFVDASNVVHNFSRTIVIGQFSAEIQSSSDLLVTTGESVALSANVENLPYSTTSTYAWSGDDDSSDDTGVTPTKCESINGSNSTLTYEFDVLGDCVITLTVTNSLGWTTTDTVTFTANDEATTETISAQVLAAGVGGAGNVSETSDGYGEQIYVDLAAGAAGVDFKIVGAVDGSVTIDGIDLPLVDVNNSSISNNDGLITEADDTTPDNFTYNFYDSGSYALTGSYQELDNRNTYEFSKTIIVGDLTPSIVASLPPVLDQEVTFTANVTTPSGSNVTGYTWASVAPESSSGITNACAGVSSNSKTLTLEFDIAGTCELTLTVTNNLGWDETATVEYEINEEAGGTETTSAQIFASTVEGSTANHVSTTSNGYGKDIYLDLEAGAAGVDFKIIGATSGEVTIAGVNLPLVDVSNTGITDDDGNAVEDTTDADADNFNYEFYDSGAYALTGTYYKTGDSTAYEFSKTIIVGDLTPTIVAASNPDTVGQTVTFTANVTTPSGSNITGYTWASVTTTGVTNACPGTDSVLGNSKTLTLEFDTAGTCELTLTATNNLGWSEPSESVTYTILAEDAGTQSISAQIFAAASQATAGTTGEGNVSVTSDGIGKEIYLDLAAGQNGVDFRIAGATSISSISINNETVPASDLENSDLQGEDGFDSNSGSFSNDNTTPDNFTYNFYNAGSYSLLGTYQGTDPSGNAGTFEFSKTIIVGNLTPTIVAASTPDTVGQTVTFTANVTTPSGSNVTGYTWSSSSDSDACAGVNGNSKTLTLEFNTAGTCILTLTAANNLGWSETTEVTYTISAEDAGTQSISAQVLAAGIGDAGNVSETSDGFGNEIYVDLAAGAAGVDFTVTEAASGTLTINGVTKDLESNVANFNFYDTGSYPLTGEYLDANGESFQFSKTIIVGDLTPTIVAASNPDTVGQEVTFTANVTTPSGSNVTGYTWSSSSDSDACAGVNGNSKTLTLEFNTAGTCILTLTAANNLGWSETTEVTYTISAEDTGTESISAQVLAAEIESTNGPSGNVTTGSDGYGSQIYLDLAAGAAGVDFKIVQAVSGTVTVNGDTLPLVDVANSNLSNEVSETTSTANQTAIDAANDAASAAQAAADAADYLAAAISNANVTDTEINAASTAAGDATTAATAAAGTIEDSSEVTAEIKDYVNEVIEYTNQTVAQTNLVIEQAEAATPDAAAASTAATAAQAAATLAQDNADLATSIIDETTNDNFTYNFYNTGSYSLTGEYLNTTGDSFEFSKTIIVEDLTPTIVAASNPDTVGQEVTFTANVTTPSGSNVTGYTWASSSSSNACPNDTTSGILGNSKTLTLEFDIAGTCELTLTATNNLGWSEPSESVTYTILAEDAGTQSISAQIFAAASQATAGTTGEGNVSVTSDGIGKEIYLDLAAGQNGVDFRIAGATSISSISINNETVPASEVQNSDLQGEDSNSNSGFSDDNTTEDNFTYNFYNAGSYSLLGTYQGTDPSGNAGTFEFSKTIIVGDLTPTIVEASPPDTVGETITFTANVTTPSGSNVTGYTWASVTTTGVTNACPGTDGVLGNSKTLTLEFDTAGTCELTLTATNNLGWSETTEVTYTIAEDASDTSVSISTNAQVTAVSDNSSPNVYVGNGGYDTTIYADSAAGAGGLTFTVVGATSGTVTINNAELSLTDSNLDTDTDNNNFSYTFREVGTYSMNGTYEDGSGGNYSFSKTVIIMDLSAEISENTTVETVNDTIILSAVATTPSGTSITSYAWAGDSAGNCTDWTDTGTSTQYTFATAGECKVTLTVENSLGWTDTDETSFVIAEDTSSTVSSLLADNEITDTQIQITEIGGTTVVQNDGSEIGYSDNAGYSTYIFADTVAASTGLTFTIVLADGESLQTGSYSISRDDGDTTAAILPLESGDLTNVSFTYAFPDAGIYELEGEYTYTDSQAAEISNTFTRKVVVDSLDVAIGSSLSSPTINTETELWANVDNVTYTSVSSYAWGCEFWETTADPESDDAGECPDFSVVGSSGLYDWPSAGTYDLTLTVVNSLGWSEVATKTYSVSASSSSSATTTTTTGTGSTIVTAEAASDNTASGVVFVGNDGLDPYIVVDPEVAAGGVTFTVANAVSGEVTINGNVTRVFSDENGDAINDNFTHSFYTPGSHSLSGSYYDSAGGYYSFTRTVIVDELEVSIAASFTPTYTGDTVTFTAQTTTPLSTNVNSYSWSCTGTCSSLGDEKSEEYTFSEEGTYTISVTVTNTAGQTASDSKTYEIEENPISVTQ